MATPFPLAPANHAHSPRRVRARSPPPAPLKAAKSALASCTVSLATVTAAAHRSGCVPMDVDGDRPELVPVWDEKVVLEQEQEQEEPNAELGVESCVPFPVDGDAAPTFDADSGDGMPPRRVRARTGHVLTPMRTRSASSLTPLRPLNGTTRRKGRRISSPPPTATKPHTSTTKAFPTAPSTPLPTLLPAELRLIALVERTISARLREIDSRTGTGGDENDENMDCDENADGCGGVQTAAASALLDAQDGMLAARLRATLTRHGWRTSASPRSPTSPTFPTALALSVAAPSVATAVLTGAGTPGNDVLIYIPTSTPRIALSPLPLRCPTITRSGSTRSARTEMVPPMCSVVARVLLRRAERAAAGVRSPSDGTQAGAGIRGRAGLARSNLRTEVRVRAS